MATFAENIEHIDMLRTPLKTRNQEFTPARGKRQARFNSNLFVTPTKKMMSATPRSTLGNKTNYMTPNTMAFKKPRMSPNMKIPVNTKTPGRCNLHKQSSTPNKFSVYEDEENDETLKEMKRKNFKIEQPEKCPWSNKSRDTQHPQEPLPALQIVDDFHFQEPMRKKLKPMELEPLPQSEPELQFQFDLVDPLPQLPDPSEDDEVEICPWDNVQDDSHNLTPLDLQLDISTLSDLEITKEMLSQISIRCFNDSILSLEDNLSEDELPDIPSTPELDQELAELLELSFDTFHL